MQWPENYPPETALEHAIIKDKSDGKYPVPGYGWTLADKRHWLTQEKIDRIEPLPAINISNHQSRWYHNIIGIILTFAAGYIIWQAFKLYLGK